MSEPSRHAIRLAPEPEEEPEPKGTPMPHPFIIQSIRVISASGEVREINPREWPRYGWEKPC